MRNKKISSVINAIVGEKLVDMIRMDPVRNLTRHLRGKNCALVRDEISTYIVSFLDPSTKSNWKKDMTDEFVLLTITGQGRNMYGKVTVYYKFEVKCDERKIEENKCKEPSNNVAENKISKELLLPYQDYNNLAILSAGTTHTVSVIGQATTYGGEHLIVKISETIYQAGEDLEKKVASRSFIFQQAPEKIGSND